MTDEVKDGGAAFPHLNPNYDGNWDKEPQRGGMSLRDWFASQVVGHVIMATKSDTRENGETHEQMFARRAYAIADALLSARKGQDQ
jgi:hypothetical protein